MSGTRCELRFAFIVADTQHWTKEHNAACEDDLNWRGESVGADEWVISKLDNVMRVAALQFIKDNPDLFQGEWIT